MGGYTGNILTDINSWLYIENILNYNTPNKQTSSFLRNTGYIRNI